MSKAFTRESDDAPEDEGADGAETAPSIPMGTKNYMTPAGALRLREELKQLLYKERPEVVRTVSWAASNGDRSENGDYIYGKRRLREIDRRIRFLTKRLEAAQVVDPATQRADHVLFGATVTISDEEGRERTYRIVGIDEAEPAKGHVSWISPLAKALLNAKVGDSVVLRTPKGEEELEVLSIRYEEC
ncbi:MAG: transcription elongation factor GreB [Bdellovibrionales bacterium GWB1_55_8]|nr:MAG: transcription elongation factor GreB [Bdellovibrionales bacterium GWB1_55_8]